VDISTGDGLYFWWGTTELFTKFRQMCLRRTAFILVINVQGLIVLKQQIFTLTMKGIGAFRLSGYLFHLEEAI
jgi:hypothetical protein